MTPQKTSRTPNRITDDELRAVASEMLARAHPAQRANVMMLLPAQRVLKLLNAAQQAEQDQTP